MFRSSAADKKKALEDEAYTSLCNPGPDLIILDEGHRLRKDKTRLYQILTSVKTRRRVVLTGCVRGACSTLAVYGCRRVRLSCSLSLSLHPTPLSLSLCRGTFFSLPLLHTFSPSSAPCSSYPLQNHLREYWCMVDFASPGLLGGKETFKRRFEIPITDGMSKDSGKFIFHYII